MSIGFGNTYGISAFNHCKLDLNSGRRVSAMLPRIFIDQLTHDGVFSVARFSRLESYVGCCAKLRKVRSGQNPVKFGHNAGLDCWRLREGDV